jgi:hypothetical protein
MSKCRKYEIVLKNSEIQLTKEKKKSKEKHCNEKLIVFKVHSKIKKPPPVALVW